jgi:hypothetical protein
VIFDLLVDRRKFDDELRGQLAAGAPDDVTGPDRVENGAGLGCGQELLRPAGQQFQQQPQRDGDIVDGHLAQARGAQGDDRDAVGVDGVGLAALAGAVVNPVNR